MLRPIGPVPDALLYQPDYITPADEAALLAAVAATPRPKWKTLLNRRLQQWGGIPHPKGMLVEDLPPWLQQHAVRIGELGLFTGAAVHAPNHCLLNEYTAGQGIMPHTDGPLYYPTVTTITLGSHTLLDLYPAPATTADADADTDADAPPRPAEPEFSVLLQPRSLVVVRGVYYTNYLHGIAERERDTITPAVVNAALAGVAVGDELVRTTRVSLTFRVVEKVLKTKVLLPGARR